MSNDKLVVAFISGKGGVGKTMLAVAFAAELAGKNRVLLIDLDFFNRGLTGLMGTGKQVCAIAKPQFLESESQESSQESTTEWFVVQVSDNLFHIRYPDLLPEDMRRFETLDVDTLKDSLREFVIQAADACGCDSVVLDCHGGPDNTSFAACLFSNYGLLVSEPDRITFYGTLNFIRQIERVSGNESCDLRLIFNKVIPAFSALFLNSFYDKNLRAYFSGQPLLAILPLEVYLTKEFEKTPFLANAYPNSLLSRKTRTMIYDLLCPTYKDRLSPSIKSMPRLMRFYRKFSLGNRFPLLRINFIMVAIVTVALSMSISYLITLNERFAWRREQLKLEVVRLRALDHYRELDPLDEKTRRMLFSDAPSVYSLILAMRYRIEELRRENSGKQQLRDYIRETWDDDNYPPWYENYSTPRGVLRMVERIDLPYYYFYDQKVLVDQIAEFTNKTIPSEIPDEYRTAYAENLAHLQRNASTFFILPETIREKSDSIFPVLAVLAVFWIAASLLLTWTRDLDRLFTYNSRQHKWVYMLACFLIGLALWFGPALLLGVIGATTSPTHPHSLYERALFVCFAGGTGILFFAVFFEQVLRTYRDIRYERHLVEDLVRLIFLVYVVAVAYSAYRFNVAFS